MRTLYLALKYAAVLLRSVFVVFPFLWALSTSFKDANEVTGGATWIPLLHYEPSVAGWHALFGGAGGVNVVVPFAVWVMVDFFNTIPRGRDEMAWMDRCLPMTTFLRVILPNAVPGLVVAGMFCVIFGWNDVFFALTLTFTQTQLLPVSIVSLNSSVTPWWALSAAALVSVAPLIVLAFVVERYLSRGGLAGAVR